MKIRSVSKAIAGGVVGALAAPLTVPGLIPEGIDAPWWGYLLAGIVQAVLGFAVVYLAPANR